MNLFDSHAHYNDEKFDIDRDSIIKETLENNVSNFIVAGYSLESSKKAVEIAKKYDGVYSIVGISPNDLEEIRTEEDIENNIKEINGVNDCIVVPIYKNNIVTSIKAYVTLTENIDSDYIKKELEQLIPKYMMPRTILIIENMPLNDNGKVDRKRLINYD